MAPRRRCPVCGSKQWHKEPSSGLITCSEGHVLLNYRNETTQVTELGPHALRKRTLKSTRKKRERQSKADPNLYHGDRARYHYFQCLQLLLRMQIVALRKAWDLPLEFEVVCRDVWALHLSLLPNPPPAEHLGFSQEQDVGKPPEQESPAQAPPPIDDAGDEEPGREEGACADADAEQTSASSSSEEDEDDPEMAELLRENSETGSSSSGDDETGSRPRPTAHDTKKRRPRREYDAPASNIAVLMVTCWTLRLPVMYADFVKLIESYELPYLDPVRLLPTSLAEHLTKHTTKALSPQHAPTPLLLHALTSRLAKLMYSQYGVYTPEMNLAPVLWRAVRALCGTPTLYILAKRVARVLSVPVMLHRSLASPLPKAKKRDPGFHWHDSAVPEVSLISAVIVVLKMVYGLDGKERLPREDDDPASALPRLSELLACIEALDDEVSRNEKPLSATSHLSVLDMDESSLDEYIDFCEKALLPNEEKRGARNAATAAFPVSPPRPAVSHAASRQAEGQPAALAATPVTLDQTALRPGEAYTIYNTLDVLGALPEQYETVIKRAAHWAGVEEDYVATIVERFERRLVRWWGGVRRREREEKVRSE